METNNKTEKAIFAGGCFWGIEHHMKIAKGVIKAVSGYIGGHMQNPTYEQVCSGTTGHAEAVEVTFDREVTDFRKLAILFFEIHDPTTYNRQGPDVGSQYRSEIFYLSTEQKEIAGELISILKDNGYDVVTKLSPAGKFYPAEEYHQNYYAKTGSNPYCHFYKKKFHD